MKVLKAMIQYIKDTKRFQPKATVMGETEVAEEAEVAQGIEERDDEVGGSL
jgi:hypothetical protein